MYAYRHEDEREAVAEACRRSFGRFVREAYGHLGTGTDLCWGWYLDAVAEHLQALVKGDIKRLIINLRNRSLKSTMASVCLHPWAWLTEPSLRFFTGGYDANLSEEHSWASRQLINGDWYQSMIAGRGRAGDPLFRLVGDQNVKKFYANTRGGRRMASHVGAGTGKGGRIFIVDDPLSIDQSYSNVHNEVANRWVRETVLSRLDDPQDARVCVVQHRLRTDDTTADLLQRELGFEALVLRLQYDPRKSMPATSLGWVDPRKKKGESLCEERWGPKEIATDKTSFGPLFPALCDQDPKARGQNVISMAHVRRWVELPDDLEIVQTWDLSFKGLDPTAPMKDRKPCKTCGMVWGFSKHACYAIDHIIGFMDYIQQKAAVIDFNKRWTQTRRTYIEDAANGSAMLTELKRGKDKLRGVIGVNPGKRGGKYQRFAGIASFWRAGDVHVPEDNAFPWVRGYVETITSFPNVQFDEEVDVTSQVIAEEWLPERTKVVVR